MSDSNLKTIFEDYLYASNSLEKSSTLNSLIEKIFKSGFDENSIEFLSKEFKKNQKQELIREIFKELEHSNETEKIQIINTLSSFLTETTPLILDQIIPVYFKNLSDKKNFQKVFTTLKIFTSRWQEFNDNIKKKIFFEFLNILDNPLSDLFIEEGIFEITKIILNLKSSEDLTQDLFSEEEINDYLKRLINITLKGKSGSIYAALESIQQILEKNPKIISKEIYDSLSPLFKKILKKIAIFYPAKRDFIKVSLSFVNSILMFEKDFCDEDYINNLKAVINKMVSKIDHADIKYLLEIIVYILKKTENLPKIETIKPIFDTIRSLFQKKDRLDDYVNDLVNEIINIIWPLISDEEKDEFFKEIDFRSSNV